MAGALHIEKQLKIDKYFILAQINDHIALLLLVPVDLGMLLRNRVVVSDLKVVGRHFFLAAEDHACGVFGEVELLKILRNQFRASYFAKFDILVGLIHLV